MEHTKCLIIGGGPAGYTAAIYATRANLSPVLYEGMQPGGQLTTTTEVENFPGYPEGVDGTVLVDDIRRQAVRLGADIRRGIVTKADLSVRPFRVEIDGETSVEAETLIIATGATAKYLGLPSENKFRGMGVSACATLRRDVLRASKDMQEKVLSTPNIEVLWNCNTREILGDDSGVTGVRIERRNGEVFDIPVHGFFLAIGHHPNSDLFKEWVETDETGYIVTEGRSSRTNVEGVFAAGDVKDPDYRQAITAAASGCVAALDAERYLASLRK